MALICVAPVGAETLTLAELQTFDTYWTGAPTERDDIWLFYHFHSSKDWNLLKINIFDFRWFISKSYIY